MQVMCFYSEAQTPAPKPTGSLAVGRRTFLWIDSSRAEPWKPDANQRRRVLVYLWYPAEAYGGKQAEYFPNARKIKGHYSDRQKKAVEAMTTVAVENAACLNTPAGWPVLLFSAGGGMPVFFYTALLDELASHGYIIAAIDHVHEGVGQVFPDGRVERPEVEKFSVKPGPGFIERAGEFYRRRVSVRTDDMEFVMKQLQRLNEEDPHYRKKMDLERVGTFGHSIGGVAALQAASLNERIKAAINYDGLSNNMPYFPMEEKRLNHPVLFITKELKPFDEEQLKRTNMTKEQDSVRMKYTMQKIDSVLALSKAPAYKITLKNASHESFSDVVFFETSTAIEGLATISLLRKFTLLFFDYFLKGRQGEEVDAFAPGAHSWGSIEKIR